jgi:hypothetical protein
MTARYVVIRLAEILPSVMLVWLTHPRRGLWDVPGSAAVDDAGPPAT